MENQRNNVAAPTGEVEEIFCDNCSDSVFFKMRDNYHEFYLPLSALLDCLAFAVECGDLPKLPGHWWQDTDDTYGTDRSDNPELRSD